MVSASDWTPMEPMRTDDDNHADLFGGDLFSDELLDIYNAAEDGQESSCPDEGVPLSNGMSQILEQSNDGAELNKDPNGNMGYGGLAELSSTPSMNDFTSILEGGSGSGSHSISITPSKVMDSILITKNNNNSGGDGNVVAQSNGKKRAMADSPQSNPNVKKKATTAKTYNAADNSKGNTIATAGESQQLVVGNTVAEQNNAIGQSIVPVANISKDISSNKGEENNTPDPLTLQEQNALAMKIANSDQIKVEPATVQVPVLQQQPAQVPSSYQNQDILINTPKLVSAVPNTTNSPSSGASVSTVKTEESFKGVAQAAVNNLILSAGQNAARYESTKNDANGFVKAVDTTTTHVAALTSNNWVAACAASISDAPPGTAEAAQAAALAAASDPAAAKAARARRATLTADERARQNRDRNREHARNTRLRKKAYVEELKRTLTELVTARDASEIERRHEKQREIELRSSSSPSAAHQQEEEDGNDGSHHGPVKLDLPNASELIEAASIEISFPDSSGGSREHWQNERHVSHTYDLDWRDDAGGGWHGRIRGGGTAGTAHFVASPVEGLQENRLAGVIHRGDGTVLRITTRPDGSHWFESWIDDDDESASALGIDGGRRRLGDPFPEEERQSAYESMGDEERQSAYESSSQSQWPLFGDDDGSVIDHLTVYTRRAMCEHALVGFYPCPPTPHVRAPIEEFIALQVSVTNYVLSNTRVPARLNSVHVFMDPEYDQVEHAVPLVEEFPEEHGSEIGVTLGHLKEVGSGHLEEARRRQNVYCADVVTLIATIGLGLASGTYNVCNHKSGGWCFAHEVGHSISAGHRDDSPDKVGYKYGYGFGPDSSDPSYYATIMAWGGKKVPMYSTPDYTWEGKVVGTDTEDNRRSIIENLVKTTNKRRSEMCKPSCEYGSDGTSPLGCPSTCSKCHFPPNFCYDDPFFRYNGEVDQDCEWVRFNPEKCPRTVSVEDGRELEVKDRCPVSCGACPVPTPAPTYHPSDPPGAACEDDPSFLKNGAEGRGCDWVANSIATRCADNAGDGYLPGEKIYDRCRLTCNMCHVDLTPPPSPAPCVDVPGNHFQGGTEGCDWIAEKVDVRCEKYSKAVTECPETCGLCDAPTPSPTPRGPCADDDDWVYEAPKDKYSFLTCEWVRDDPVDRCNHSKMKHYCPVTCGTCCEDEPGWFKGINGEGDGNPDRDCAYYGENGCGSAAMGHCPRTCGLCPNYLANAGGPHSDEEDSRRMRNLRWGAQS